MGTKRLLHLGFALLLLSVLTAGLTWGLEGGEIPPAPRLHGTFRVSGAAITTTSARSGSSPDAGRNLDSDFWSASNWTRVRFYLLGLSPRR